MSKEQKYYYISEQHINEDEVCLLFESEAQESFISQDKSLTEIKKELIKEYKTDYNVKRKCLKITNMYQGNKKGNVKHIGFVISCKESYEDSPKEFYNKTIWLTFHKKEPVKTVTWDTELANF